MSEIDFRNYVRKNYQFAFRTEKERDEFENMLKNLKYKLGITQNDMIMKMALKLLSDKVNKNKEEV